LPTLYIVNSLVDGPPTLDGQLTLREALLAARTNAASGDAPAGSAGLDTITFAQNLAFGTIKLQSAQGELLLNGGGGVNVIGPVAGDRRGITISGQSALRVFHVTNMANHVLFDSLTMTQGSASSSSGGGLLNAGGNTTLTHVGITQSTATISGGGISNTGTLTLNSCTIANNTGGEAAGIDNTGLLIVNYSRIDDNTAISFGGGIVNSNGTATITGSTIAGNHANTDGGGLSNGNGTMTIISSTISGNQTNSVDGGGIDNVINGTLRIFNSTIAANITQGIGGGIDINSGTVTIVNCTIVGNADTSNNATGAGGIAKTGGTLTLANCIVAQNNAGPSSADNNVAAAVINNNNSNFIGGDPKLGPLQDNGGPTFTMNPQMNSPVVDEGNNTFATDTGGSGTPGNPLLVDQRGGHRFVDGNVNGTVAVDVGAVEFTPGQVFPIVVGPDLGHAPEVKVYDVATSNSGAALHLDFNAYEASFQGGVRIAVGDINGDAIPDIVTAPGGVKVTLVNVNGALMPQFDFSAGRAPEIKVFSGVNGTKLDDFLAYPSSFTAGVFVALGDVDLDGKLDIIAGPEATGQSGHTNVRVFFNTHLINTGAALTPDREFNAYDPGFGGGVRVAAADLNRDGNAEIITAPGIWSGPDIRVFDGHNLAVNSIASKIGEFLAYDFRYFGGVFVSTGDVNRDGRPDIVTGTNGNGGPEVKAFSGASSLNNPAPTILDDFFAYDPAFNGGARVSVLDVNGDGKADIITGSGPGGTALVRVFDGGTGLQLNNSPVDNFLPFDVLFSGGVFVGG
jgi:hypothetical protein